jgi:hypothetical protein
MTRDERHRDEGLLLSRRAARFADQHRTQAP